MLLALELVGMKNTYYDVGTERKAIDKSQFSLLRLIRGEHEKGGDALFD